MIYLTYLHKVLNRTFAFPDKDGTFAMLSDITAVPTIPDDEIVFGSAGSLASDSTLKYDGFTFEMSGDIIKLLTSDAPQFNAKIYTKKAETSTSGFTATQYAEIDRDSGTGTMWADVVVMNDFSTTNNPSGGTVSDFRQVDKEGASDTQYVYGRETNVRHRAAGDVGFLNGHVMRVQIDGKQRRNCEHCSTRAIF